jgi:hypothetical protein
LKAGKKRLKRRQEKTHTQARKDSHAGKKYSNAGKERLKRRREKNQQQKNKKLKGRQG